jgi:tetratricopeptide (TPR) repeat protein
MIRHQVYFDTLGSMREDSASWRSVFAGLSVLRLIDSCVESGASIDPANWAQLHSVRSAIDSVNEGDPVRGVLTTVLEAATRRPTIDEVVCSSLLAYGRALDYEASWGLATDVFSTVAKLTRPEKSPKLAVEANILVGGAARRNGDWETSGRAYSQAAYIADTLGDREGVLTVQVGIANTYMAKGNLPHAQTILDDVIVQAQDQGFSDVQGIALHSRATLYGYQGNYADGLKTAYQALAHTRKPVPRDQLLEDIGGLFTALGRRDAARDAHLILANTAQSKLVRWSASLNLMELASLDGNEPAFDTYARQLAREPLNPWVRAHYLLFLGEGFARFGRYDAAEEALLEASAFANGNQIHQLAFQAQSALETVRLPSAKPAFAPPPSWVSEEVDAVIRGISDLRKATVATSA